MNMRKERNAENNSSCGLLNNVCNVQNKTWYLWRKEWVRPYESVYSVIRNFCRINVVNCNDMFRTMKISRTNNGYCNGSLLCISDIPLERYIIKNLLDVLLPDDYYEKLKIFNTCNNNINKILINKCFIYCPECMKENYHSVYHNITNSSICIFHKVPLIHTNIEYGTNKIRYNDGPDKIMNVVDMILPCERKIDNSFYKTKINYECFIPIARTVKNESNQFIYRNIAKPYEGVEPDYIIKVEKNDKSLIAYDKEFTKWFVDEQKMCHNLLEEKDENRVYMEQIYPNEKIIGPRFKGYYHYIELFLYYKFRESIRKCGFDKFYKDNRDIIHYLNDENYEVGIEDKEMICGSFVSAAVGSDNYYDSFTTRWIIKKDSSSNRNDRRIIDMHFAYLTSDIISQEINIDKCMMIQIVLAILNDQYDYMYEQYLNKVKELGKIKAYYIHEGLRLPEYYITCEYGNNCYKILRYN